MKLSTLLPLAGGAALGYVLGSAAGRARYEQLVDGANQLLHHPSVQQTAFDLAGQAKAHANRIPGPASGLVDSAATRVQDSLTQPDQQSGGTTPGS